MQTSTRASTGPGWHFWALTGAAVALYTAIFLGAAWRAHALHCLTFFDFGFYSQAVARLSLSNPNPRIDGVAGGLFNDHFDPIVWLTYLLRPALSAAQALLVLESACVLAGVVPLIWLVQRGRLQPRTALLGIVLLLFNAGTVSAVSYPVHPTTWAAGPMVWLVVAVHERRLGWALAALLILFACKEEFPFAGLALGAALLLRRDWRSATPVLLLSAAWAVAACVLRPALLGPVTPHAAKLYGGLLTHPWLFLQDRVHQRGMWSRLGSLVATLAPLGWWMTRQKLRPPLWLLSLIVPALGMRFLGIAWRLHYMGCVMAACIAVLLLGCKHARVPRWAVMTTALILVVTNSGPLQHAQRLLAGRWDLCPHEADRLRSVHAAVVWLQQHPVPRTLVGANLLAQLGERDGVYPLDPRAPHPPYDIVFVERAPHGNSWPLPGTRVESLVQDWRRAPGTQVIIDDGQVFLARGTFTQDN